MQSRYLRGNITVLVVLLLVAVGVLIVVASGIFKNAKLPQGDSMQVTNRTEQASQVGESDEIGDVEEYLEQTDLESLDSDIGEVDKELSNL